MHVDQRVHVHLHQVEEVHDEQHEERELLYLATKIVEHVHELLRVGIDYIDTRERVIPVHEIAALDDVLQSVEMELLLEEKFVMGMNFH